MRLVTELVVPPRSGKGFTLERGQRLRVLLPEGPQVVDFCALNRDNPKEAFSSSVTRQTQGTHVTVGDRLYSCPRWERVMLVVTADTVRQKASPRGARSHDLLFGRCSRIMRERVYGSSTPGCQENLTAAMEELGLNADYVHDPFNIFMKTGVDENGRLFFEHPDAVAGDYLEMRAEMDLLIAVSTCPGLSSGPKPHPVCFQIYDDGC